jgi:hypothetical protein
MLGRLVDYFSQTDEPVVLAFWGDHLPYLGDNRLGYAELGLDIASQETLAAYETPYVIWVNDAAADALDWENTTASLDLPDSGELSASFLGAALLELTGRGDESAWFSYLNQLRRELPVVQKSLYVTLDGVDLPQLDDARQALLQKWRCWSYYKLRYKEIK